MADYAHKSYMNFGSNMTREEFCKFINDGTDIMFDVREKHYTAMMEEDSSFSICEQYKIDKSEPEVFYYKDGYDLVNNFLVDGVPLSDIYKEVCFYDYKRVIWDNKEEEEEYTRYVLSLIESK